MNWHTLLPVPLAMVLRSQSEELTERTTTVTVVKFLLPFVTPLFMAAGVVGGMKWALGDLRGSVTRAEDRCFSEDAILRDRVKIVEYRQAEVLQRLAAAEAIIKLLEAKK